MTKIYDQILDLINTAKKILILGSKPDGDSIGASLGLKQILKKLGKSEIDTISTFSIPEYLKFLGEREKIITNEKLSSDDVKDYDLIFILDTSDISRCLNGNEVEFAPHSTFVIIDHHEVHKANLNSTNLVKFIDKSAESTCGLIADLMKDYEEKTKEEILDKDISFFLFTGIVSDTDYFGYNNVTKETFLRSAYLKEHEFDQTELIYRFRETLSLKAFEFIKNFLPKVNINEKKKYAYLKIYKTDFAEEDLAFINEASNFMNRAILRIIDVVDFAFILKENSDEVTSIAFRGHTNGNDVDLSKIATKFGGGGHKKAAGVIMQKSIEKAEIELTDYLEEVL